MFLSSTGIHFIPMIVFHLKHLIAEYERRHRRRLTMGEIAAATGIYRTTLSKIASPSPYNTTTDNLDALCRFFECELHELAEYVPDNGK